MKHNVGGIDCIARLLVCIGIVGWGVYEQNWWGAIGIIPLFTAVTGLCLAYLPFGISTSDKE